MAQTRLVNVSELINNHAISPLWNRQIIAWTFAALEVVVGAFVLGILSDRFGRKKVLFSILIFGPSSLLTMRVQSPDELMAVRFLTGIGIGGVYPTIAALASEYTPNRIGSVLLTLMFQAFHSGPSLAGSSMLS